MSFGNILGQLLQQGVPGQRSTHDRVGTSANNLAQGGGGGGLEQILARVQGALGGGRTGPAAGGTQAGGFAEAAKDFFGQKQAGGMTGAQLGGIGAVAGALFGGGIKGAARGGALALIGTLALQAIRKSQEAKTPGAAGAGGQPARIEDAEVAAVTSPESERLALRAMIAAAKADGEVDQAEMDRILGKLADDEVTPEERRFVLEEIRRPLDPADIAREVTSPAQAAEVYAASLLAIDIDSEAERTYLRRLAEALKLDDAAVAYLHETTGAPRA
jgi:uncharacterized membrane protein YebE (DUF533 family)